LIKRLREKIDECCHLDEYDVDEFQSACLKFATKLAEENVKILITSPMTCEQISTLADEK
jgi:hypothetical protein